MKGIAVALLLLLVLAASGYSQVPDDKLIVPGQRIGKWTLEMTINDLLKMNGPRRGFPPHPDVGPSPLMDFAAPTYEHHWDPLACFYALTHRSDDQKVTALGIGYPTRNPNYIVCPGADAYKTTKGHMYTADALEAAYGKPTAITFARSPWGGVNTIIFDKVGLAAHVWVRYSLTVAGLLVFRPGTARTIWKF